jgi:signal transduction histidine kinase
MTQFQSLSENLQSFQEYIIEDWESEVKKRVPASLNLAPADFRVGLLLFYAKLVEASSYSDLNIRFINFEEVMEGCKIHGRLRGNLPIYELEDLALEYSIFKSLCLSRLSKDSPEARDKISAWVDHGLSFAILAFMLQREFSDSENLSQLLKEPLNLQAFFSKMKKTISLLEEEKKTREKSFLALIHDLRNPLAVMKSCSELMKRKIERSEIDLVCFQRLATKIIDHVDHSDCMIKQILDISMIESEGRSIINPTRIVLNRLLDEMVDSYNLVYQKRFKLITNPELIVFWDIDFIKRVIENLFSNAIKHGHQDDVYVEISKNDKMVTISINNKSDFIPAQELDKIFVSFKQYGMNDYRKRGWGLGLTLVRGIVDAHGGRIRVQSDRDKGITFFIDLPEDSRELVKENSHKN